MFQVVSCIHLSPRMPPMANKNLDKCVLLLRQMMDRDSGKNNICRHQEAKYYLYVLLLLIPCRQGDSGHSLISVFVFFLLFSTLALVSLSAVPNSFYLLLSVSIPLPVCHSFRSLFIQSSHHNLGLLCFLLYTIHWTSASFASSSPPILST